tara:strand:+ start:472 stop:615 length:144 start_codon:yes stop_codon:yes gene_type:complete
MTDTYNARAGLCLTKERSIARTFFQAIVDTMVRKKLALLHDTKSEII